MEQVNINGRKYTFVTKFKDNYKIRESYNDLTLKTFGFHFEQWYQYGYWGEGYIPYSLMDGDRVVANVSASPMEFIIEGEVKRFLQLGTVMTEDTYRGRGLSRYLIERIIREWQEDCTLIYLFANDGVLNFYPRYGFTKGVEYEYSKSVISHHDIIAAVKLDLSLPENRELLYQKVRRAKPIAKPAMVNNPELILFYAISSHKEQVYYSKKLDMIAIAEYQGDTLYLLDYYSTLGHEPERVIQELTDNTIRRVILGFAPEDVNGYEIQIHKAEDSTLFLLNDKESLFSKHQIMFPVLSHA